MSLLRSIFLIVLFAFCCSTYAQIDFESANYESCKQKASADDKPFLVYLYADWCLPCQMMNTSTFMNSDLSTSIDGNIDPYKIDFDTDLGRLWSEEFGIACLPTTLLFDASGTMLHRIESSYTSVECIGMLAEHNMIDESLASDLSTLTTPKPYTLKNESIPATVSLTASKSEQINNSITVIENLINSGSLSAEAAQELEKSLALLRKETSTQIATKPISNYQTSNTAAPKVVNVSKVTSKVIYSEPQEIFEVQLGLFRNETNAVNLSAKINSNTSHKAFILQETKEGKPMYRVLLGAYSDKADATLAYNEIKAAGYNALLKAK